MAVVRASSRKIALQRKVYLLQEGFSLPCKKNRLPPRRDIVEVGAKGLVGKSTYSFLTQIGLSSRERNKAMIKMSEAAEAA